VTVAERAQELRAAGLGYREIGATLGVSGSKAWKLCNPRGRRSTIERILAHCVEENRGHSTPCLIWTGYRNPKGYGRVSIGGRLVMAHRAVYELLRVEVIPPEQQLDHLCRQPACVNPDHLEPVSNATNARRGFGRLTEDLVREIRRSTERGVDLAARLGVSPQTISHVRTGRTWRGIT
jgi:hypothetical protein